MNSFFKFLKKMFTAECMKPNCCEIATEFPHGIPCCENHACEPECSSWLGYECDCAGSSDYPTAK